MTYLFIFKVDSIFAGLPAVWSISAHLSEARFIENSLDTLKIGGVAVHTTEFNLSSGTDTFESRDLSIYRRCDIESPVTRLEQAGHRIEPLDFSQGATFVDGYVDLPPYRSEPHLRLRIGEYDCTSIGLIITRGPGGPTGLIDQREVELTRMKPFSRAKTQGNVEDDVFIADIYRGLLGRDPDEVGMRGFLERTIGYWKTSIPA